MLADGTRVELLWALLDDELPVNELAAVVGKPPAGVSQHLAKLRMARLVRTRRQGTRVFYRIENSHVRQLVRRRPLEVEQVMVGGRPLRVPTLEEILRIKAWLVLRRNATRDHLDVVALADRLGLSEAAGVILGMDDYYEDQVGPGGRRVATQLARQLEVGDGDVLCYTAFENGIVEVWSVRKNPYQTLEIPSDRG